MENKNKAEEIKKIETLLEVLNKHGSFIDLSDAFDRNTELCVLEAMGRYRQSEIDELTNQLKQNLIKDIERTKEIEEISKSVDNLIKEKDELTKEVERLRKEREWISVFRSDIKPPINTPILCKQKANDEKFTYLILGVDDNGEFRDFNTNDYIDSESELYSEGHYPYIEYWQPLPPISQ